MIPLLVPIGLGLIGGYLSQDSTQTFAGGGGIKVVRQSIDEIEEQGIRVGGKSKKRYDDFGKDNKYLVLLIKIFDETKAMRLEKISVNGETESDVRNYLMEKYPKAKILYIKKMK